MNKTIFFRLSILALLASCDSSMKEKYPWHPANEAKIQDSLSEKETCKSDNLVIECDSLYGKDITLHLDFLNSSKHDLQNEYVFYLIEKREGKAIEIFRDTVECNTRVVEFADYNNDKVKDILIQNDSDVRSNWTYNLFLFNKDISSLQKIKGFNEIKNPNYLPQYGLIDNMVMSGRNWTSFYKIEGDTIKNFGIIIYDGEDENGVNSYVKEYMKAIKNILKGERNSRVL